MNDSLRAATPPERSCAPRGARRWAWRVAVCFGGTLVAAVLAEGIVRVLDLGPRVYAPRRFEPGGKVPFTRIPGGPIVYVPNTTFSSVYDPKGDGRGYFGPGGRVTYHINRYGMRGPELAVEKPAETFRVVCLGDSLTFGEGVRYADTYPARLEALLSRAMGGRRVEVINAGVQAYGTMDALYFFGARCERFSPDVVTLGFFLNDASDSAETIRQNEALTKPLRLSPLARVSRLWEIIERGRRAKRLQAEYFETTRAGFRSDRWRDCQRVLKDMGAYSRQRGFRFVVVVFPIFYALDGRYPFEDLHEQVRGACRAADVECVDLLDVYRGERADRLWVHPTDQHPNEIAHRMAADRIARYLLKNRPR